MIENSNRPSRWFGMELNEFCGVLKKIEELVPDAMMDELDDLAVYYIHFRLPLISEHSVGEFCYLRTEKKWYQLVLVDDRSDFIAWKEA